MKAQIQLILSTIALTVLIWTYADQSGHESFSTTVVVKYVPPSQPGNRFVLRVVGSPADTPDLVRAELTFRGPTSAVRRLQKDTDSSRFMLTVVVGDELTPGRQPPRSLFNDLARLPEIRNRGLSLQSVHPDKITLEVDRYKTVTADVELLTGVFEKTLVEKPVVRPEKVEARVLESTLAHAGGMLPPLRISIEDELQARAEQSGGTFSFDVPIRSTWQGIDATFNPQQVRVTVRFARRTIRERITLIPLSVLVKPQDFFDRYEIEWQDETGGHLTQAIDVRVPLDKAGQLKGNMIDAYITIEDTDLPKDLAGAVTTGPASSESWIERDIRFVFPPGFEDVRMEGTPRTVKFRIKKKAPEGGTPDLTPVLPLAPLQ